MKTLRRLCATFVLALALALPAFAGDMSTTVVSPPPRSQAMAAGDITTGVTATDPTADILLSLLQSLLSLF